MSKRGISKSERFVGESAETSWRRWASRLAVGLVLASIFVVARPTSAATIAGTVMDPQGLPVPGAQVSLLTPLRSLEQRTTDAEGRFRFEDLAGGIFRLVASAGGLSGAAEVDLRSGETRAVEIRLALSALEQQVVVSASMGSAVAAQTGSSVSVISRAEIGQEGVQTVFDALRQVPGVAVSQAGRWGGVTGVFIRGGNSNYNLVMIDGIPVNQFGGGFDFAPLTVDGVDRIEVTRGPESALYGSNAVTGVVNIVTEHGEGSPHFSLLEEAGSFSTWRVALGASGRTGHLGWAANAGRLDSGGVVPNDTYHDQSAVIDLGYSPSSRRRADFHFFGNANNAGAPGPYGSDPDHLFTGLDLVSRDKQNLFGYSGTYTEEFSDRFQQVVTGTVTTNDYYFRSAFGDSFSNNLRGIFNTRSEVLVSNTDFLVAGFEFNREQIRNSFIANAGGAPFTLPRTTLAYFVENRWSPSHRLFLTTGVRVDNIRTRALPPRGLGGPTTPLPSTSIAKVNPRLSAAYLLREGTGRLGSTRLHASAGTGIRAPDGFELAFTDNPHLKPEKSVSFDTGVEQSLWRGRATLDATYFYDRFEDQIVVLGGSLTHLSSYVSDNLGNARAEGLEFSARFQPTRSLSLSGEYTLLDTALLKLDGSSVVQAPFRVGQELVRRPRDSDAYDVTWQHGRWLVNSHAYIRGSVLDLEPNFGAFACTLGLPCLLNNPGYIREDAGFSFAATHGLEFYGRVNNLFNQKYEESLGFPALHVNFMAGIKFNFHAESGP